MSAVPHSTDIPVPQAPLVLERNDTIISEESVSSGDSFFPETVTVEKPHLITQPELNDLVRDLTQTKQQSELLASRLGEWNLLDVNVRISSFRKRSSDLEQYFAMENNLCYCKDIPGLLDCLDLIYDPSQWRFFIDASLYSNKGVLLHNGNTIHSIPIAYSVILRETYENLEFILDRIKYNEHE